MEPSVFPIGQLQFVKRDLYHQHADELYEQDEEYHSDGVHRSVGHAGHVAVDHRVGSYQARSTGHTSGDGSEHIERVDFQQVATHEQGGKHGHQGDDGSYAEHQQSALLEGLHEVLARRGSHLGQEEQKSQLAQELV